MCCCLTKGPISREFSVQWTVRRVPASSSMKTVVLHNSEIIIRNTFFPGLPVTIRLLDPPLHEFLPEGDLEQIVSELTADTGTTEEEVYARIEKLSEVNPMLGFRGCRYAH